MKVFKIELLVDSDNLMVVLDVVKDSADLVGMTQVEDHETTSAPRVHRKKRPEGMTGRSLIVSILADGSPKTLKEIVRQFKANHFSPNSASPCINEMIRENLIQKVGDGIYQNLRAQGVGDKP